MVPLRPSTHFSLFIFVFSGEVWVAILFSVLIIILCMTWADKVFLDKTNLITNGGFVLSRICADATKYKVPGQTYKRIFFLIWTFAAMFLIMGYIACLRSKLSLPKVEKKIKSAKDLASQNEIPWAIQESEAYEVYASEEIDPSNLDTKHHVTINEKAEKMQLDSSEWYGGCYTTETKKDNKGGNSLGQK